MPLIAAAIAALRDWRKAPCSGSLRHVDEKSQIAALERVSRLLDRPYARDFFRLELVRLERGCVELAIANRPELGHRPGAFQGAITTALGEYAASWSALTLIPADWNSLTLEQSIHFTGPAEGERLIAVGSVLSPGRSISVCRAEIVCEKNGVRHPCGTMTQTNRHMPPRGS